MIPDMLIHLLRLQEKREYSLQENILNFQKKYIIFIRIWESRVARYRDGRLSIEATQSRDGQLSLERLNSSWER
jgi:hypothetical protein